MTKHTCHAVGCKKVVPPKMLFCGRHWHMTPKDTQRLVWQAYRPGQEIDKRPSLVYLVVQSIAVAEVAVLDGRFTPRQREEHVKQAVKALWPAIASDSAQNALLKQLLDGWRPGGVATLLAK